MFQRVNRLFTLSFEENAYRTSYNRCFLPTREIKDYDVMIDGNIFDTLVKNDLRKYDSIQKIAADQEDDFTTGCLLD